MFNIQSIEDIDKLIKEGVDINKQDSMFGQTFLHMLVQSGSSLLDYFLSKGPDPNIRNRDGKTPIFYSRDVITIKKLINGGASLLIKDNEGHTVNDVKRSLMIELIGGYVSNITNR